MIVGIGVDVVDIARFEVTLQRTPQMRTRLFTVAEQALSLQSLAARFAAKEALAKALGGPTGLVWTDAEVVVAESGAPELLISGTVQAAAQSRGVRRWHLSLAHDGGIATAIVLAEG